MNYNNVGIMDKTRF